MIIKDTKPFNLELVTQGHPICTKDGREAKFIAHVPDANKFHRLIVQIEDEVYLYPDNGVQVDISSRSIYLAPLGYCEGKPVFAGDVLEGPCGQIIAQSFMTEKGVFDLAKWPRPKYIVETKMDWDSIMKAIQTVHGTSGIVVSESQLKAVANASIERAIVDGDVIPTKMFVELVDKVYGLYNAHFDYTYSDATLQVMDEYKKGLNK